MLRYGLLAMENEEQEKEAFHVCSCMKWHMIRDNALQKHLVHCITSEHVYIYHIIQILLCTL